MRVVGTWAIAWSGMLVARNCVYAVFDTALCMCVSGHSRISSHSHARRSRPDDDKDAGHRQKGVHACQSAAHPGKRGLQMKGEREATSRQVAFHGPRSLRGDYGAGHRPVGCVLLGPGPVGCHECL